MLRPLGGADAALLSLRTYSKGYAIRGVRGERVHMHEKSTDLPLGISHGKPAVYLLQVKLRNQWSLSQSARVRVPVHPSLGARCLCDGVLEDLPRIVGWQYHHNGLCHAIRLCRLSS